MVFPALKQGPMLTLGSDELSTDAEWEWNERLRQYSDNKPTGWHSSITLEAFVIPIAGAANPGTQGLLHHLVHRYLSKRCSYFVFALPAVQVRGCRVLEAVTRRLRELAGKGKARCSTSI